MKSIIEMAKTPVTKRIRRAINKLSTMLTAHDSEIDDETWKVLRDWFFMMGNATNGRLPENMQWKSDKPTEKVL